PVGQHGYGQRRRARQPRRSPGHAREQPRRGEHHRHLRNHHDRAWPMIRWPGVSSSVILLAAAVLAGPGARAEDPTRLRVFDLGLTDPRTAAQVVRPLLSPAGRLYEDPAQHRLIVSDRPDVLERVAAALRT